MVEGYRYWNGMYDMSGKWWSINKYVYKLDSVSNHEKSKGHEKSAAIAKVKSESTVNSDAYKILKMLNSENFEKLNKMLRTCHATAYG
jgi:hypothetical protein